MTCWFFHRYVSICGTPLQVTLTEDTGYKFTIRIKVCLDCRHAEWESVPYVKEKVTVTAVADEYYDADFQRRMDKEQLKD